MTTYAVIASATNICDNVVVWDDAVNPWTPPADHYIVNIDGVAVGIGWYYDPNTQVWTPPPTVSASFAPNPVFIDTPTTLSWTTTDADNVKLSTFGDQLFPANGSQDFTFTIAGSQSVYVTAIGLAGQKRVSVVVKVATTQAEMSETPNVLIL